MPLSRITSPFQSATANVYSPSANTVTIRTASADRVTVDSSGRVGVNYTALSNNDVSVIKGLFELGNAGNMVYGTGGVQTGMITNLYYNGGWKVAQTGSAVGMYYQLDGEHTFAGSDYATSAGSAGSASPATTILRVVKGKSISLQGASPQNGTGITFPASQSASSDANTLDDYEEGTWTATASPSSSGSITFDGDNTLFYTKVGRIVTVSGRLDVQSVSSPSGELRITLPFTVANAGQTASSSCSVFIWNAGGAATEAGLWISWLEPNNAFAYFRYGNTGTPAGNAAQYIQSGTEFRFNVTYVAA
jgi:hypothetical protein